MDLFFKYRVFSISLHANQLHSQLRTFLQISSPYNISGKEIRLTLSEKNSLNRDSMSKEREADHFWAFFLISQSNAMQFYCSWKRLLWTVEVNVQVECLLFWENEKWKVERRSEYRKLTIGTLKQMQSANNFTKVLNLLPLSVSQKYHNWDTQLASNKTRRQETYRITSFRGRTIDWGQGTSWFVPKTVHLISRTCWFWLAQQDFWPLDPDWKRGATLVYNSQGVYNLADK